MMNKFVGKICPYCKSELKEDEDIVVCSHCEIPHHKDCWIENEGCTTFDCQGTIQEVDIEINEPIISTPESEKINNHVSLEKNVASYCSRCGNKLLTGSIYCNKCSFKVSDDYKKTTGSYNLNGELNSEFERYIEKNTRYYLREFSKLKGRGSYSSWNWSAFLFAPLWCTYRKLYSQAIIILSVNSFLACIGNDVSMVLLLISFICTGAFANYFYMRDLERKMERGKILEEPKKSLYISRYGGVTPLGLLVMVVICLIIGWMLQDMYELKQYEYSDMKHESGTIIISYYAEDFEKINNIP